MMTTTTPVQRVDSRPADTCQVLILRLWRGDGPSTLESPHWQWSAEDPRDGTRRGFANLGALGANLEALAVPAPSAPEGEPP